MRGGGGRRARRRVAALPTFYTSPLAEVLPSPALGAAAVVRRPALHAA